MNAVVDSAGNAIPGLTATDAQVGAAASEAFSQGTRYSAFAAAAFLVIGLLATLRLSGAAPADSPQPAPDAPARAAPLAVTAVRGLKHGP